MNPSNTQRFTNRVDDYVRYRPTYPEAIIDVLADVAGLSPTSVIADLGSGTGISAALFLRRGWTVCGVEPNDAMRTAAESALAAQPHFHSVKGTAEATTLGDASIDLVTAAQAFHWFDIPATRLECQRILRPTGWAAVLFNDRRVGDSPLLQAYERLLLEFGTDYHRVRHGNVGLPELDRFFGGRFQTFTEPNEQQFDFDGLRGRLVSSSFAPTPDDARYPAMIDALRRMFEIHQRDGRVRFLYDTHLYVAPLGVRGD